MVGGRGGRVHVFQEVGYARRAAAWIGERMRRGAAYRGSFALALAGGAATGSVYGPLARVRGLPWRKTDVFFSDERAVPAEDGRDCLRGGSSLLDRISIPPERIHRMRTDAEDREEAARRYAEELPDRLDLVLLDLGEDGRIASLTPGSAALASERRVVVVATSEGARRGLCLGPGALRSARTVAVLARGDGVAGAVAAALGPEGSVVECPARLASDGHWLLDPAAAAGLRRRSR